MAKSPEIAEKEEKCARNFELKCRRCRTVLTTSSTCDRSHIIVQCCTCIFLNTEGNCLDAWINKAVENSGWTSGKLKCPKCNSNVGGFNFLNPIPCGCNVSAVPAVWFVKAKVDENHPISNGYIAEYAGLRQRINAASLRKKSEEKSASEPSSSICVSNDEEVSETVDHCECLSCHPSVINNLLHDEEKCTSSLEVFGCQCGKECRTPKDHVQLCSGDSAACQLRHHLCLHEEMKQIRDELSRLNATRDIQDIQLSRENSVLSKELELKEHIKDAVVSKLDEVDVNGQHLCPVCLDLLYNPYETPCQHVFCSPCLQQLHHTSGGCPLCPLCRQPVHFVRTRLDLEKELQTLYPPLYKNRHRFESCRPCRLWPLPSPSNTNFTLLDTPQQRRYHRIMHSPNSNETNYLWMLLADTLSTVKLVVLLFCHLLLLLVFHQDSVTAQNDTSVRRSAQKIALLLFSLTISCVLLLAVGALLVYAFDFVKLALVIILCYAGLVKLVIAMATDRN